MRMLTITLIESSALLAHSIFSEFLKTWSCSEFFPLLLPEPRRDGWTDSPQELSIPRISSKRHLSKGLSTMNRQLLDSHGPIPGMTPAQALTTIQAMADHSQKWHDETTSRYVGSNNSDDGLAALVSKLDNLGRDMKKLKESVHAIREAETKTNKNKDCKAIFTNNETPLYTPFYYSPEEIKYFLANSRFLDDDESKNITAISDEEFNLKQTSPRQTTTYYIESYVLPTPFPKRLEQHAEEALIHKTMESLKKIKSNRPFLKEIRKSNKYPKYMKDLVTNKPLTMENEDVRMNHKCSALLLNQLPPKEKDPGSFILPCSIGRLDFDNALADLRESISIMPFSMYKRLGIGNLETIKMNIELADNSKYIPKGIVRNLLIKINKFILPIDFIILDILEDFRMPVILGRPLLATAHTTVDVLKKSISLEVGNEKVIFKMKSDLPDIQNESVLMIKSNMITKEDELVNIESDLFTYITNTCESCHLLAIDTDLFTYEVVTQETYEEIAYKSCLTAQEAIGENTKPFLVEEMMKKKILTEHWRKQFGVDYDDNNDFYDPDQCREGRNNEIQERIINNLHEEWFKGTSNDKDDIEGIIDYLEPMLYEGFIDLDDEEYNKRRCRLLGMSYIEPPPIIIEQVKITRYSLGLGKVYTKLEVSNIKELPRTRRNIATIRSNIMDEVFESYEDDT
ncbi:hypothetical protein Tco_1391409 [Tanacetum coccineum]